MEVLRRELYPRGIVVVVREITPMSEPHYPNENQAYRDARDALLKDEQELVDKVKALAAKRRALPLGGELKQDYVFERANNGKVGERVKFSALFEDKQSLMIYSLHVRAQLGHALLFLHLTGRRVRPDLAFSQPRCGVRGPRQGAGAAHQ